MQESPLLELQLRALRLSAVLVYYRPRLSEHTEPLPYLSDLIALETTKRQENGTKARIAAAHFPTIKTLESFDFSLRAGTSKSKGPRTFHGAFVSARRNLILSGPPGVGKSHNPLCAWSCAPHTRYRVLFTTAAALLMRLTSAKRTGVLEREYRSFDRIESPAH